MHSGTVLSKNLALTTFANKVIIAMVYNRTFVHKGELTIKAVSIIILNDCKFVLIQRKYVMRAYSQIRSPIKHSANKRYLTAHKQCKL